MEWQAIDRPDIPCESDAWVMFGGWTEGKVWSADKLHVSLDGMVNGWSVARLIAKGYTHWCAITPPDDNGNEQKPTEKRR